MKREQAEKRIRRKSLKVKSCPFCGNVPEVEARCDTKHSEHGSWGFFATRQRCCPATGTGQTELFFCNDFKAPDYKLWWRMFSGLVNDWNRRIESDEITRLREQLEQLEREKVTVSLDAVTISRTCAEYILDSYGHQLACSLSHQKQFPKSKSNNRHLELQKKYSLELKQALSAGDMLNREGVWL